MAPANPIERWVRMVETQAYEIGVTVVVHGLVITGVMTPFERFGRWTHEVFQRAARSGGKFDIPAGGMLPLTREEIDRIRSGWKDREEEQRIVDGIDEQEQVELDLDLSYFCIRNAEVRAGSPATWFDVPYLLLRTASVDAFFPGSLNVRNSNQ